MNNKVKILSILNLAFFALIWSPIARAEIQTGVLGQSIQQPLILLESVGNQNGLVSSKLKDKTYNLLFIWGSWCSVCKAYLPELLEIEKKFQACDFKLHFLAVNDTSEKAAAVLKKFEVSSPVLVDQKGFIKKAFSLKRVPTLLAVTAEGKITDFIDGKRIYRLQEILNKQFVGKNCAK